MQLKARKTLPLGVNLKMEKLGQHDILLNGTGDKGQTAEECLGLLASHLRSIHSLEAGKGREDSNPVCFLPFLGLSFPVGTIGVDEGCPKASLGFPYSSVGKGSASSVGDLSSIPGLGRSPVEEKGYPLQYSGLENSMDCKVHRVTKSRTRPSYFHFTLVLESEGRRCTLSSQLALKPRRGAREAGDRGEERGAGRRAVPEPKPLCRTGGPPFPSS